MAQLMKEESKRPFPRALFVVVLAAVALSLTLPNIYDDVYPVYGSFGMIWGEDHVACCVTPRAEAAGARDGDRLDLQTMPMEDRYWDGIGRAPLVGKTVTFLLTRGNAKREATLTAQYDGVDWAALWREVASDAATLILVVVVSALVFIRWTALSRALFLFAIGNLNSLPIFFSFLPVPLFIWTDIATGMLKTAGAAGFLAFALLLGNPNPPLWRRRALRVLPFAFAAIAALGATFDLRAAFWGLPEADAYTAIRLARALFYCVGAVLLIATACRRSARIGERAAAVAMAVAGVAAVPTIVAWIAVGNSLLPTWMKIGDYIPSWLEHGTFTANLFASTVAAYVIIRERVVDTGAVISRVLFYAVISAAILAIVASLNWIFATRLSGYAIVIPVEIIAAATIGYLFSGLRDVAGALSLAAVDAPRAEVEGRAVDASKALTQALGFAERTRQRGLIAEVRARCAFSSWIAGDDEMFEEHIGELSRVLGSQSLRGLGAFARSAVSDVTLDTFEPADLPEWRARAALVACGQTIDVHLASEHARDALTAARTSGLQSLVVLALVAVAETAPAARENSLREANEIAASAGWFALTKSLFALRSDARDLGMLQSFVDVRLRKKRPDRAALDVSFFTGEVHLSGTRVDLPVREHALLLTVALARTAVNLDELTDSLWPEADGDAARNAFHACLHRLRKHTGDPRVVRRIGAGYTLHPGAVVDLWTLQDQLAICAAREDPKQLEILNALYSALRHGREQRATLGPWFAEFEQMLSHKERDALRILADSERYEGTTHRA
jgi:hypothetical protein